MDKTEWGNAVLVREPCRESAPRAYNGGHSGAPGRRGVQHERYTISESAVLCLVTPYESHSQGFGVTARSTIDTRKLDPTAIIVFHQA